MSAASPGWQDGPVVVRAPATSANLGPGFDALGLALSLHDVVRAEVTSGGLDIGVSGEGERTAATGERHLVVRAMRAAFSLLGGQPPGLMLSCQNAIPHGRGLGSSAAAIVAGLLAARGLATSGAGMLPDEAVFRLAAEMEGHPDNVAACLYGGLTIAWAGPIAGASASAGSGAAEGNGAAAGNGAPAGHGVPAAGMLTPDGSGQPAAPRAVRLDVLAGITPVMCVPPDALATAAARRVLPPTVPHRDAAANAARSALLVAGLTAVPSVLFDATEDYLHQRYRAGVMPGTAELVGRLRAAGVPAVVSGAGPSVLAFTVAGLPPGPELVDSIATETGTGWRISTLDIDRHGATLQTARPGERPSGRTR